MLISTKRRLREICNLLLDQETPDPIDTGGMIYVVCDDDTSPFDPAHDYFAYNIVEDILVCGSQRCEESYETMLDRHGYEDSSTWLKFRLFGGASSKGSIIFDTAEVTLCHNMYFGSRYHVLVLRALDNLISLGIHPGKRVIGLQQQKVTLGQFTALQYAIAPLLEKHIPQDRIRRIVDKLPSVEWLGGKNRKYFLPLNREIEKVTRHVLTVVNRWERDIIRLIRQRYTKEKSLALQEVVKSSGYTMRSRPRLVDMGSFQIVMDFHTFPVQFEKDMGLDDLELIGPEVVNPEDLSGYIDVVKERVALASGKKAMSEMGLGINFGTVPTATLEALRTQTSIFTIAQAQQVANHIKADLLDGLMQKEDMQMLIGRVRKFFKKPIPIQTKKGGYFLPADEYAQIVARSEVSRAAIGGKFSAFDMVDVSTVIVVTGNRPCPICRPHGGKEYPIEAVRGVYPRHPQCMCTLIAGKRRIEGEPDEVLHTVDEIEVYD